ncbi:pyridoxamine 5'-phosphate oxidase family protein [Streptomyces sp. JJ66]|uniref:pyridoxamine 5'-phosphate oxidase family protein n=1 Tax=Streptomyces sp. JJ66 TaxID=2803843 RepID=UPI001C575FB0|nr:pyridoxamine 5'-phosphate oxidase family protein [Streptomyces sp. JJ66]MBW1603971.1 pyridoxamine 5'-phosphate oxidase family protein [Streptomyces sp. JJ66]
MAREQRAAFLSGVHVGVLGVRDVRRGADGPLLAPVWYAYEPGGDVVVQTGRSSLKARCVLAAGRFSLCVQTEAPPYRYVSVEGPVVEVRDPLDAEARAALAHRYLPPETAGGYLAATASQLTDDITLRMRPEHWRSADFAAFAQEFS